MVSLAPSTPEAILVPPPVASPLPPSDAENIPPVCCSNPPPPRAPLVPIEEVMSDAEGSDAMAERVEQALNEEMALSFLNRNNQGRGACCQAVCSLSCLTIPTLIKCNQETIVQEEGEAYSMASTSNSPTSIAALNDVSEGMNPHQRDHPMGVTTTSFLTDFQMDLILRGLQVLLPCCPLSLWSLQGAVTTNELGQYRLEVSLALTEEEGD